LLFRRSGGLLGGVFLEQSSAFCLADLLALPADRYQVNVVLFYISPRKEMFGKLADR